MLRSTRFSLLLATLFLAIAPASGEQTLTREGNDWVELDTGFLASGKLTRLRVELRGNAIVRGGGGNQLGWRTRRRVQAETEEAARALLGPAPLSVRRWGDGAAIQALTPGGNRIAFESEILIPSGLRHVEIATASGNLMLRDLPVDVIAGTGGGRVDADRIAGRLEVSASAGDIIVGMAGGEVRAITGGGTILVRQAGGDIRAETAGGDILVDQAGADVFAAAGAGSIQVVRAAGAVTARTAGGRIRVGAAGGPVISENGGGSTQVASRSGARCESLGGPIRLSGVAGALFAATSRGGIFADLLAGHAIEDSILSAGSGDITVLIPSNLAVTVEVVSESGTMGRIITEFAEVRVAPGYAGGRTVASGKINGGGPLLKVAAARGAVILKRK